MECFVLLANQPSPWQILAMRVVFFIVGLVMLGVGYYAVKTKQLLMSRRQRALLNLFGVTEVAPRWATIGGTIQLLIGCVMLALPIVGPSFGVLGMHKVERQPRMPRSLSRMPRTPDFEEEDDYEPPAPLTQSEVPLPMPVADEEYLVTANPLGHDRPGLDTFVDSHEDGGILVGVQVTKGERRRDDFESIQLIYQDGEEYRLGQLVGREDSRTVRLLAKPGFVVGGMALDLFAGRIRGLKLTYYRMSDGRIDPGAERYESEVLGETHGRSDGVDVGQPIVGAEISKRRDRIEVIKLKYLDLGLAQLGNANPSPLPVISSGDEINFHEIEFFKRVAGGRVVEEQAPEGGVLVGFRAAVSHGRRTAIDALQGVFQVEDRYVVGNPSSPAESAAAMHQTILAKPGYAVGGWEFFGRGGGLRVTFMKVRADGKLDLADAYESTVLGQHADEVHSWRSEGSPVVALRYRAMGGGLARPALGVSQDAPEAVVSDSSEEEVSSSAPVDRIWTNQAGKSIRARLIRLDLEQDQVTLQRAGSSPVTIPLSKLSEADQAYLRAQAPPPK